MTRIDAREFLHARRIGESALVKLFMTVFDGVPRHRRTFVQAVVGVPRRRRSFVQAIVGATTRRGDFWQADYGSPRLLKYFAHETS